MILSASFPASFEVTEISCSGKFPIIFGRRRELGSVETDASILVLDGAGLLAEPYLRTRSRILSGAAGPRGDTVAIVQDEREHFVVFSHDAGKSWSRLSNGPPLLLGAAMGSQGTAYAWTSSLIYFSSPIDSKWTSRPFSPILERGRPVPVVDSDGWLWVVQNRQRGPISRIVALDSGLEVKIDQDLTDKIVGIAASGDVLALALQKNGFGSSLVALADKRRGSLDVRKVSDLGNDLVVDFDASVSEFAAIMSRVSGVTASRYVVFESLDGGAQQRFTVESDMPEQVCITPSGIRWVAGEKHLWRLGD